MKKVNIVIGRFQPFTTGHYSCVKAAMNKRGLPTVICMINVPENKVDQRHPFPTDMLVNLYGSLFKNDRSIAGVIPVQSADIVKIAKTLREFGFEIAAWTCGTDRYAGYLKQSTRYHDVADLSDDFELIEVPRGEEDVSATKARNCLLNDDRKGFLSMIPPSGDGDKLYNALKTQIDTVYGTNEILEDFTTRSETIRNYKHITVESKQSFKKSLNVALQRLNLDEFTIKIKRLKDSFIASVESDADDFDYIITTDDDYYTISMVYFGGKQYVGDAESLDEVADIIASDIHDKVE